MPIYVFDVDNTLYPLTDPSEEMRVNDHVRVVAEKFGISEEAARIKNKELYKTHGCTYAGLVEEVPDTTFKDFFGFSEKWDYSKIHSKDPEFVDLIANLDGKKYIYSAGNRLHVSKTLEARGFSETLFDGIFGAEDGDLMHPKPQEITQEMFIEKFAIDKREIIFFDDTLSCIRSSAEAGWERCVWVNNGKIFLMNKRLM